jgi:hypothetical protein
MLTRLLLAVLNGIVTFIVILIIVAILNMVGLSQIGGVISPFAWVISLLVGILTFLGVVPNYWTGLIK